MKLLSIRIEFEREPQDDPKSATVCQFRDGKWDVDGLMYSRYFSMLHDIWKLIREQLRQDS